MKSGQVRQQHGSEHGSHTIENMHIIIMQETTDDAAQSKGDTMQTEFGINHRAFRISCRRNMEKKTGKTQESMPIEEDHVSFCLKEKSAVHVKQSVPIGIMSEGTKAQDFM